MAHSARLLHTVRSFMASLPAPHPPAVVVGLSGGADSVALLSLLCEAGCRCVAVHCHFGLRGDEADRDLRHAEAVAARLGAEFLSVRFPTRTVMAERGISAEMACRELRYDYFEQTRRGRSARWIAVAHHREDNVETMLLNLLRGCGLHGVRAMLPVSGHIIRPLLEVPKSALLGYLRERGLDYVTDSTNASSDYRRNRLRNEVLPALYAAFPDAADALTRSLANLRGCEALYSSMLPATLPPLAEVKCSAAPATLLHELLAPCGFNSAQTAAMLTAESGAAFLSATHRVEIDRGQLTLTPLHADEQPPARPRLAHRRIAPADFRPRHGALYLDASALEGNPRWELRLPRTADRMRPFGMKGTRLLSDIFATAKLTAAQKRRQWLLTRNDEILWAVGLRASAHFPVTPHTTEIIEIYEETGN